MAADVEDALSFHREHPAVDLHADTLLWARFLDYDLHAEHRAPFPKAALGGHVDLPRLREGGVGAQFFGLVSLPVLGKVRGLARVIHDQIDALDAAVSKAPERIRLVRTLEEVRAAEDAGALAALLGIEGAHSLEGSLDRLSEFARRGARYLGLLHFSPNEAGFPAYGRGRRDTDGLTAWGRDLVRLCESERVIVDLSHINRKGFFDACAIATKPVIVSHTGVAGAYEHWRNIDDEQLRAVAKTGGCAGVIFCPRYLGGDGLEPVVRHLQHIVSVAGEDVPALGSDWDGFIVPTRELADPTGLPHLTEALLRAKFPPRVVAKIMRENALRVLGEC